MTLSFTKRRGKIPRHTTHGPQPLRDRSPPIAGGFSIGTHQDSYKPSTHARTPTREVRTRVDMCWQVAGEKEHRRRFMPADLSGHNPSLAPELVDLPPQVIDILPVAPRLSRPEREAMALSPLPTICTFAIKRDRAVHRTGTCTSGERQRFDSTIDEAGICMRAPHQRVLQRPTTIGSLVLRGRRKGNGRQPICTRDSENQHSVVSHAERGTVRTRWYYDTASVRLKSVIHVRL